MQWRKAGHNRLQCRSGSGCRECQAALSVKYTASSPHSLRSRVFPAQSDGVNHHRTSSLGSTPALVTTHRRTSTTSHKAMIAFATNIRIVYMHSAALTFMLPRASSVPHSASLPALSSPSSHPPTMSSSTKYLGLFDPAYVSTFAFTPDTVPFSTFTSIMTVILCYYIAVLSTKQYIAHRGKPFGLNTASAVYNASLSLMSLVLLLIHLSEVSSLLSRHSLWSLLCDEAVQHTRGSHVFVLYVMYLTKFLELSDTLLLCLRGKPTPFIHLYHHGMTVFFAFLHLHEQTCIAWTMPILNLSVHVFLYAYFALHDLGVAVWWKRYLTLMQVSQFYLTFIPSLVALVPRVLFTVSPTLPFAHACHGSWTGVCLGIPLLCVYLYLFQSLYKDRYKQRAPAQGVKAVLEAREKGKLLLHARLTALKGDEGVVASPDETLRSDTMWGANGVPYWRRATPAR